MTIARALVNEPAIIWADEPTGNLDTENTQQIMDLLIRLNEELGQTYILVTHDPDVGHMAHRIVNMEGGKIHSVKRNGKGRPTVVPSKEAVTSTRSPQVSQAV